MYHITSGYANRMFWMGLRNVYLNMFLFNRILSFLTAFLSREKNSVLDCLEHYSRCNFREQLDLSDLKRRHMCSKPRGHGLSVHLEK